MALEVTAARLTGDVERDIRILSNQVFQLEEQLRYQLRNLDVTNFNDLGLARYENGRMQMYAKQVEIQTEELRVQIENVGGGYTSLKATVDGIQTTVAGHTTSINNQNATNQSLQSQITQTADKISAVVSAVDDSSGNVTAASIVAAINSAGSTVKISADHVQIEGDFVTFTDLSGSGTTVINGDNIITGQIKGVNFIAQGDITAGNVSNSFVILDDMGYRVGKVGYAWQADADDFRRSPKMYLMTEEFYDGGYVYRPSVKILGAGGVSIETNTGYNPVYIASNGGYITLYAPAIHIRDYSGAEWEFSGGALYKNGQQVL